RRKHFPRSSPRKRGPRATNSSVWSKRPWGPAFAGINGSESVMTSNPRSAWFGLRLLDRPPNIVRRRRHGDVADAVHRKRIDDCAHHHGWRRGGAAFAARLDAERI